jgi:hypothetical protein
MKEIINKELEPDFFPIFQSGLDSNINLEPTLESISGQNPGSIPTQLQNLYTSGSNRFQNRDPVFQVGPSKPKLKPLILTR